MTTALLEQPIFFGNALTPQALSTRIRSLLHFLKLPTSSIMTDMTRCRGRIRIHPFLSLPTNLTRSESLSFRSVNTHSDFTLLRPNQLRYRSRRPTSTFRGEISTQVCPCCALAGPMSTSPLQGCCGGAGQVQWLIQKRLATKLPLVVSYSCWLKARASSSTRFNINVMPFTSVSYDS